MSRKRGSSHDPTPQHVIGIEGTGMIPGILDVLSPREASVITLRYGLRDGAPRTLDEIGKEFGVSRERIREIVVNALHTLRDSQIGLALAVTDGDEVVDFVDARLTSSDISKSPFPSPSPAGSLRPPPSGPGTQPGRAQRHHGRP